MKRLAPLLMFAAWLLYGAMPVVAMQAMPMMPPAMAAGMMMAEHGEHHDAGGMQAQAGDDVAMGDQPSHMRGGEMHCPHGAGKICVAPFCSACLVLLPEIAFADTGRFVHSYPEPVAGPSFVVSEPAPLTPPPRA